MKGNRAFTSCHKTRQRSLIEKSDVVDRVSVRFEVPFGPTSGFDVPSGEALVLEKAFLYGDDFLSSLTPFTLTSKMPSMINRMSLRYE